MLDQPHDCACCRPSTLTPMPDAMRIAPIQSIGSRTRSLSTLATKVSTSPMMAIGMFTQKIDRQVHSVR